MLKICLFMIVKNESKIIRRCLESVKSIVDFIVISDTGSTDNTVDIIEKYLEENNIPGKVYHNPWENFGKNRSLSFTNAVEYLDEFFTTERGITMLGDDTLEAMKNKIYCMTIDADMKIVINPSFKKDMLTEDQIQIAQKNHHIIYYNTRFLKASKPFICISVTHEFWSCKESASATKLSDEFIYIDDIGDGGAKADKIPRDIRLLKQGLEDEPKNERYMFYLAQTYKDAGMLDESIEYYKKRIAAGGWFEEIYISYKAIGDMYLSQGKTELAIDAWLNAVDVCPDRSETIYKIIRYYRDKGKNTTACMFLKYALAIELPKDCVLFIEHEVYTFKLFEELSICGYYTKSRNVGRLACQHLILSKNIPANLRQTSIQNNFFYLIPLEWSSHRVLNNLDTKDETYKTSSASLFRPNTDMLKWSPYGGQGSIRGLVRAVNYSITDRFQYIIRDPQNKVKTKNYWYQSSKDLMSTKSFYEVEVLAPKRRESHISGLEDVRLVYLDEDTLVGLAISFEYGPNDCPSVAICHFEEIKNKMVITKCIATKYKSNETQKNWAPFSEGGKLFAIYSHHPLTILELDPMTGSEKIVIERYSIYDLSEIRGSASPIKLNNGQWLILTHEVVQKDTRKYYHRFILYSKDWELQEISIPFYFKKLFVEFSLSMMILGTTLSIVYSTCDNTTEIVTIDIHKIPWCPKPDKMRDFICKNM